MTEPFNAKLYESLLIKSVEKTITEAEIIILSTLLKLSLKYPEIAKPIDDKIIDKVKNENI